MTISFEQPSNSFEIEPLAGEEPVEDAYGGGGSITLPKESDTSFLFFYDGPNGVSLVAIMDSGDGSRGEATLDFDGLPADGEWVVQDDHNTNDFRDAPDTIKWKWYTCCSDGGAFRGGLDGYVDGTESPGITVQPDFKRGIDEWVALSGSLDNPDRFELNMDEPLKLNGGSGTKSDSVSASASTLQFIPGKEENQTKDGHPLDSGLMQIFPENGLGFDVPVTDISLKALPVLDSWMGGDMTEDLPTNLEDARKPEPGKYADDAGQEAFNHYRIENGVSVSFDTTDDGAIDKDTIKIKFHETGPDGEDPIIFRGDQENSKTVLHDDELNTLPWEFWYGQNVKPSNRHPRLYEYDTEFEFDGVEGVRVLTILGGWAGFMGDVSHRASSDPVDFFNTVWEWGLSDNLAKLAMLAVPATVRLALEFLTTVPNTFTFIDFVVLADGRRFVRIWDASQYPSLAIYVDGVQREIEKMSYKPKEWVNIPMSNFMMDAAAGTTPYTAPGPLYKQLLANPDLMEMLIGEYRKQTVNIFRDPLDVEDISRSFPRKTLEIDPDGNLVGNPDNPFGSAEDLPVPLSGRLTPK